MKLITGYQSENHITALQDACWHRGIWSTDCILNFGENLDAEIISNNEIHIKSGVATVQGRFFVVEPNTYDSITINNGTAGENRIDLIVAQYSKNAETQVETIEWTVLQGTPTTGSPTVPRYTEGNIDNGDMLVQFPFFQVEISGITVETVKKIPNIVQPVDIQQKKLLFQGAIKDTGMSSFLSENLYNFKFLVVGIASTSTGAPYGYGILPIIDGRQDAYQVVLSGGALEASPNKYATYVGGLSFNSSGNEEGYTLSFTIEKPFMNVIHTSGSNHGGGTIYYVRELWGIR